MTTSKVHLEGCEIMIRLQLEKFGDDLPELTKSLHKVFVYLRIMQQASSLLFSGLHKGLRQDDMFLKKAMPTMDHAHDDLEAIFGSANDAEEVSITSFEMIYGICQSLVYLLRKTTRVVAMSMANEHRQPSIGPMPVSRLDDLENEILEYPIEKKVAIMRLAPTSSANILIMEHCCRAFHHALVIFWHCQIRKMNPRYMQPSVAQVISHLEQIEEVKRMHSVRSGHMLWPAFLAASQAMDTQVQARFLEWFDLIAVEGIGSSRVAKDALISIWSNGQTPDLSTELEIVNFVLT